MGSITTEMENSFEIIVLRKDWRVIGMTIKDILTITGGNTKVMIFSADKEDRYIRLWYGIVDDIHFQHVPYGYYDVEHMTVINEEDILQLHFEYPELSKDHIDIINEEAVGYPYPTYWIEKLFIKYRDWDYVREILATKAKDEVYNEIKVIPDEDFTTEEIEREDRITINRWSSGKQGHGIDIMIEDGTENRVIYKGSMCLEEFAKCITAQASCKIITEIE